MLHSVSITSDNIDEGVIAEALVYYGQANVVLSRGGLLQIARSFGRDNLVRLTDAGNLSLSFERSGYAVHTESSPFRVHDFGMISLAGTVDGRAVKNASDEIEEMFEREFGKGRETSKFVKDLADRVSVPAPLDQVLKATRQDVLDVDYLTRASAAWLRVVVPEYELPKNFRIETADTGGGFVFITGLDFERINQFYHRRIDPSHSSVTDSYILANLVSVQKEMHAGARSNSDVWLSAGVAAMMQAKAESLVKRGSQSLKDIDLFHEVKFEGRRFKEAINSRERSIDELVAFLELEQTRRFKTWLAAQDNDAILIEEFYRSVFEKAGWMQTLPAKWAKIFIFAGLGAAIDAGMGTMGLATIATTSLSAASDVAVGAGDQFLLSRLGRGWKPSQFIEGPAQDFLNAKKDS